MTEKPNKAILDILLTRELRGLERERQELKDRIKVISKKLHALRMRRKRGKLD